MQWRSLVMIPLMLAVAACAGKYPYPAQYVSPYEVSPRSIAQPPIKGSAEYAQEVRDIVALQATLTPEQIATVKHEDRISPDKMLYPVVGEQFSEASYPVLYDFLKRVASDSWRIGDSARDYWQSPRPWYTESSVQLHVEPIYSYGYPSGHTTTFGSWAYVLGDLMPQHREAFLQHAWSVAENRIKGGAHYPHDIAGGKAMAKAVYVGLQKNPEYQQAFAAALAEVKAGPAVRRVVVPTPHGKGHAHAPCH